MDYKEISLETGERVICDFGVRRCKCKECGELIRWAIKANGKNLPISVAENEVFLSHFGVCQKKDKEYNIKEEEEKNQNFINNL